ncbi:SpoIIE family protein phosphatase [Kineococcus sp. TBRC 1896]|uniref:SpoIIE family protein phosphatase n=1 Tax=Kineococcus mangrovi TaxID=1660183 RepID=A0ABV4HZ41_9ACTN
MSASSPQALALGEPAAVLLLARRTGVLLGADAGARELAGAVQGPPRTLQDFLARVPLPAAAVWEHVTAGRPVHGELLPGDLWCSAAPVPGREEVLLVLTPVERVHADPAGVPVVAAAPGAALSAVRGGRLVVDVVDGAWTRTTGVPAVHVEHRPAHHLLRTRDERALAEFERALRSPDPVSVTVLDQRADGTDFLHHVRAVPLLDRAGAVCHVLTWHSDVTRRTAADRAAGTRLDVLTRLDAVVRDAGEALGTSREVDAVLQEVVRVLGDQLVEGALVVRVHERAGGADLEVAAAHGRRLHPLVGRRTSRSRTAAPDPLLDACTRELTDLDDLDDVARGPGSVAGWLQEIGAAPQAHRGATAGAPALAVPLRGQQDVLGLLLVRPHPSGLGPQDRAVVVGAGARAGLLLENARLHAREHALAETLQRSLLPDSAGVAGIDGLDVWTFYAPNADHAQVGGDWYDVLPAPADGGGSAVAGIVVGDVVGHDVEAAAAMGQIRSVVRSAAHDVDDPGSVLMRVDQLAGGLGIGRMASLVYATLQRLDDGGWEMAWSSAGHLPPLLRRGPAGEGPVGEHRVEVLSEATGTLVGLGERPRPTRERALSPGDVLVLYTDGLIETRSRPMRDGLEVLVEVLARSGARDAAGIGEELLAGLGETPEDDTAIVVVRVPEESELADEPPPTADTPRRRRWQLPSEPSSIGKARHATLRACAVWGLACGPRAEIVVSELVANAVLHGWGTIGLRLFDLEGHLRIEVEDDSPEQPQVVDARPDGAGGHGMRLVASLGRWGSTPTRRGKVVWVEIGTAENSTAENSTGEDPA